MDELYAILYSYDDWDGDNNRLIEDDDGLEFLVFSSKDVAEKYFSKHKFTNNEYEIVPLKVLFSYD